MMNYVKQRSDMIKALFDGTNAMALGSAVASPADTAIPMDVDRIEKGGKGKEREIQVLWQGQG